MMVKREKILKCLLNTFNWNLPSIFTRFQLFSIFVPDNVGSWPSRNSTFQSYFGSFIHSHGLLCGIILFKSGCLCKWRTKILNFYLKNFKRMYVPQIVIIFSHVILYKTNSIFGGSRQSQITLLKRWRVLPKKLNLMSLVFPIITLIIHATH